MRPHLLIFGFGYTADFLAQKAREINIQVTATTRNNDALGYNREFDGDHQGHWVDESSKPNALGGQGQLRLAAENKWCSFAAAYQWPLTIFRLAGIYGPRRNVLARLMAGKNDTIVKDGQFFSRIHVEDIVLAIVAAMQNPKVGLTILMEVVLPYFCLIVVGTEGWH
jgi:nucleoside-diphosphate-sugar epimerase